MMGLLLADLRHALRLYLKTPWQSVLAVIMMATAMALFSATASVWSDLHLGASPGLEDDTGLVTLGSRAERHSGHFSAEAARALDDRSQTLARVSGASIFSNFEDTELDGQPISGHGEPVLPGYFETVQPRMLHGRGLSASELTGDGTRALVLGASTWRDYFDADPEVIGREVKLGDASWRVVGVADERFRGIGYVDPAFWVPYRRFYSDLRSGMPEEMIESMALFRLVGRRAAGTATPAVGTEIRALGDQLPTPTMGTSTEPDTLLALDGLVRSPVHHASAQRQSTLLVVGAVLVALVAATNLGIFLLARAPARTRELALRQALGASRRRLAGQLITEATLLLAAATLAGLVLSLWLAAGLREIDFMRGADFSAAGFDWPALAASIGLAALLAGLVAMVPVLRIRRGRLGEQSRQVSARADWFQHSAATLQLGLSGLVGALALGFVVHLWLLDQRDIGLVADRVLIVSVTLQQQEGSSISMPDKDAVETARAEIRDRGLSLPGVEALAFGAPLPGQRMRAFASYEVEDETIRSRLVNVGPGFFDTLGIRLLHGRSFESDGESGVVVSRAFAEQAWGETDAVGRVLHAGQGSNGGQAVIGVVADIRYEHPDEPAEPIVFSASTGPAAFMASVVVRGDPEPGLLADRVEEGLALIMDELKVMGVRPLAELLGEATTNDRARARVTAVFGAVIVLMAGFGFFAMQRFLVDSGQRDTAIRMALGAGPKRVRRHVLRQGLVLGLPGLVIGTLAGLVGVAWLSDDLISAGVSAPAVAAATFLVLGGLLLLATGQPAWRASRLRPGELLTAE